MRSCCSILLLVLCLVPGLLGLSSAQTSLPVGQIQIDDVSVLMSEMGPVVLLKANDGVVPIFVDPTVAGAIDGALRGQKFSRPLSHDLMHAILLAYGGAVTHVTIKLKEQIFYGELAVVIQGQIDRLNQELREQQKELDQKIKSAQETGQGLATERQALKQHVSELTRENRKLTNDTQWLRRQRELFRQSISTHISGANAQTFTVGFSPMVEATKQALLQHGYSILAKMATDKKAVFVTERKTSASPSLELPGFRNQYLLVLEGVGQQATTLKVKAAYEKISQEGKILEVSDNEKADIQLRMIRAVEDILQEFANTVPAQ